VVLQFFFFSRAGCAILRQPAKKDVIGTLGGKSALPVGEWIP
jgi:hypothetical protein